MLKPKYPNILTILKTDYKSTVCFLGIITCLVIILYLLLIKNDNQGAIIFSSLLTIVVISLIIRFNTIFSIYRNGQIINGLITNIASNKGSISVAYFYDFNGKKFSNWNALESNKKTKNFKANDSIELVVHKTKPDKVIIHFL